MEILVRRSDINDKRTIGRFYIDGSFVAYSLEDAVRKKKIGGKTAIPFGRYKVSLDYSPRFKRDMPHILDVPNFTGVRIHSGNSAEDTEGCILVGLYRNENQVLDSRLAFDVIMARIKPVWEAGEDVWITIEL